ncbi:spore germination protein [Bacillaceae bacterium S4-13-58]
MGNFKVLHMFGTSSLVVGKATYEDLSSQSKTTNGVGSAYGDGSYINMSPYKSSVNDPDYIDKVEGESNEFLQYFTNPYSYPPQSFDAPYRRNQDKK